MTWCVCVCVYAYTVYVCVLTSWSWDLLCYDMTCVFCPRCLKCVQWTMICCCFLFSFVCIWFVFVFIVCIVRIVSENPALGKQENKTKWFSGKLWTRGLTWLTQRWQTKRLASRFDDVIILCILVKGLPSCFECRIGDLPSSSLNYCKSAFYFCTCKVRSPVACSLGSVSVPPSCIQMGSWRMDKQTVLYPVEQPPQG